jgi:uncharacterized protein YxeA
MKKILIILVLVLTFGLGAHFSFVYYVPYSEGVRSGELIKISRKGVLVKTWEGEISQGISGAQIFSFSVEDNEEEVINDLKLLQGKYVKVSYKERYKHIFWLGDSNYFITKVEKEKSPHFRKEL